MLRDAIADSINAAVGGVIDAIMKGIWAAAIWLLRTAFQLVDSFTTINFVGADGGIDPASPIATIWPLMRWLSLAIALGLFFLQLTTTMLRGGRGLFRLATGPLAYAVAVGITAGGFALLFAAGDGITTMVLAQGVNTDGFVGVLDSAAAQKVFIPSPDLGADPVAVRSAAAVAGQLDASARAYVLGLVALFGVIPAALGFLLESLFRAPSTPGRPCCDGRAPPWAITGCSLVSGAATATYLFLKPDVHLKELDRRSKMLRSLIRKIDQELAEKESQPDHQIDRSAIERISAYRDAIDGVDNRPTGDDDHRNGEGGKPENDGDPGNDAGQ